MVAHRDYVYAYVRKIAARERAGRDNPTPVVQGNDGLYHIDKQAPALR